MFEETETEVPEREIWYEEVLFPAFGPETLFRMVNDLPITEPLTEEQQKDLEDMEETIVQVGTWGGVGICRAGKSPVTGWSA